METFITIFSRGTNLLFTFMLSFLLSAGLSAMDCDFPTLTTTVVNDCEDGTYSVLLNIGSDGDAIDYNVVFGFASGSPCFSGAAFATINVVDNGVPVSTSGLWAGERSTVNVTGDGTYQFSSSIASDYLTLTDSLNNVIATGVQPLLGILPTGTGYRLHVFTDASCGTANVGRTITGQYVGPVTNPFVGTFPGGTTGISVGPFAIGMSTTITVEHNQDPGCNQTLNVSSDVVCGCTNTEAVNYNPLAEENDGTCIVPACPTPEAFAYCYGNMENNSWYFAPETPGVNIVLYAIQGTIESTLFDNFTVYDGDNAGAPILYTNPAQTTQLDGLIIESTLGNGLFITLISDASLSCLSTPSFNPWIFDIYCGVPPLSMTISGEVFIDINCNGQNDSDYPTLQGIGVFGNGQLFAVSNTSGFYVGSVSGEDVVMISSQGIPGFTSNQYTFPVDSTMPAYQIIDFAFCPQSDFINLGASISPIGIPPRPGFNHSYMLCIQNMGSLPCDSYEVVLDFSNLPGVTVVNDAGGIVSGTQINWMLNDLGVFEQNCFSVTFNVPPGTPEGTVMNPIMYVNAQPDPSLDPYLQDNSHSYTHFVVAAYDPNDKTVSQPIVNYTEIEPGEGAVLEYLIHFQNTGNFFATFVRVEDVLPDLLDLNTLEMIHASHDYEIIIHEGQHIEWFFDNIMLPDSTTDEPGSHGHIHFRIKTVPDVQLEDVIENTASIFFDFKKPVITEPAITTFLDCSEGSLSVLGLEPVCPGEPITLTTNRPEFDILWSTESGTLWGAEYYLNAPYEPIEITVTASHPVCTLITTVVIPVSEVPETEINVEDNQLVATSGESYTWYLDGELIDWATQQWIVPFENGTYTVEVEYENGCIGTGEILFQSVGINDLNQVDILLVPNPARDITQLILPEGNWQVSMTDVSGKLIFSQDQITVNRYDIALSHLAPGLYFVSVESHENRMVKKLVVE